MTLTRRTLLGLLSCMGVAGCQRRKPEEIRYRLTLEVDTPEGVKTGSSVWRQLVIWDDGPLAGLNGGVGNRTSIQGEAVTVDLGERGWLFCMMTHDMSRRGSLDADFLLGAVFPGGTDNWEVWFRQIKTMTARTSLPHDVPLQALPLLARFRDPNLPLEVEGADPQHLDQVFGPGVSLTRATIQITDAPVSWSIYDRWPWTRDLRGSIAHTYNVPAEWPAVVAQIHGGSLDKGEPRRVEKALKNLKEMQGGSGRK